MDLAKDASEDKFLRYVRWQLPALKFAPLLFMSAVTGRNVFRTLDIAQELFLQGMVRVKTSELNEAMVRITARRGPPKRAKRLGNVLYATQVGVQPPTIALFVNDSALITGQYERYLANQLRREFPFSAIPVRFVVRRRRKAPRGK